MTKCKRQAITFSSPKSKKILADFNGGKIIFDAGVLLLQEIDKRINLIKDINNCIPDQRH